MFFFKADKIEICMLSIKISIDKPSCTNTRINTQINATDSTETDSHINGQLIFNQGTKVKQWGK